MRQKGAPTPIGGGSLDLAALVAEHHRALYAYAFRLSGNGQDAEDLVQQAFLVAQQKGHQIRDPEAARSWLYTVLRNGYLKEFRRRGPELAENLNLDLNGFADVDAADDWFDPEKLQAALDQLPPQFKTVLLMFYFEDISYREIAEKLELPIGTVMSRLSRAKGHLRTALLTAERSVEKEEST
ncbi:MAG: RNA polymerase sigma factor [Pirellulales bacterium]